MSKNKKKGQLPQESQPQDPGVQADQPASAPPPTVSEAAAQAAAPAVPRAGCFAAVAAPVGSGRDVAEIGCAVVPVGSVRSGAAAVPASTEPPLAEARSEAPSTYCVPAPVSASNNRLH